MGYRLRVLALTLLAASSLQAAEPKNEVAIVIADGPHAGHYTVKPDIVACITVKERGLFGAGWKTFDPPSAKEISEGGVEVQLNAKPGKEGSVKLTFGDPKQGGTSYDVVGLPIKYTFDGKTGSITFDGTVSGVRMQIQATCRSVESY